MAKELSNLYLMIMIPLLFTFVIFSIFYDITSIGAYNSIFPIFTTAIFYLIVIIFIGPLFINLFWVQYSKEQKSKEQKSWNPLTIFLFICVIIWNVIIPFGHWITQDRPFMKWFLTKFGWEDDILFRLLGFVRDLVFGHITILTPGIGLFINLILILSVILLIILNASDKNAGFFGEIKTVINKYTEWINNLWNKNIKYTPHIILPKWLDGEDNYSWLKWFLSISLLIIVIIILSQRVGLLDGLLNAGYFNFFNIILILFFMGGGYWAYLRDIGLEWKDYESLTNKTKEIEEEIEEESEFKTACEKKIKSEERGDKRTKWKTAIHKFGFYTLWLYLLLIVLRTTNILQLDGGNYEKLKIPIGFTFFIISLCGFAYLNMVGKGKKGTGWEHVCDKFNKKAENHVHIFIGGFPFWYFTAWGLALFVRWCFRFMVLGNLNVRTLGILPTLNGIMRTVMLIIATFLGGIPYWLGTSSFGKL